MKKKTVINALIAVLLGTMVFCGWKLWQFQSAYRAASQTLDELSQHVRLPEKPAQPVDRRENTADADEEKAPEDDTLWPEVDFDALSQINPDIVGWIYIEGTAVNYPIVQGADNDHYIRHLPDGTKNSSGSIFLDCDAEPDFSGKNSVLYGHNMRNGSMFQVLMHYKEQLFYESHPTALVMTPEKNFKIRFFSGYVADLADEAWELFFAEEEYGSWLEAIAGRSCFESDVMPEETDRVLTLSTCSYEFQNARFVLHGILE